MRKSNTITIPNPNAPKKLWRLYKKINGNCSAIGKELKINPAHVWNLLKNGKEPKREDLRRKLLLRPKRTKEELAELRRRKEPIPKYIKEWNTLPKEERHKAIQQYLNWRNTHESGKKENTT